jgi:uncharacterized protein YkwD
MKVRMVGLAALCCALTLIISFSNSHKSRSQTTKTSLSNGLSQAEQDLLTEINLARAKPTLYASYLEELKPLFNGKQYTPAGQAALMTEEGWSAAEDAIKFLRAAKPQGPLSPSDGLRLAAEAQCTDQSRTGATGHKSAGGLIEDRVKPFGTWQGGIGENLSYGDESARERVLTWLIDDGFASRGHRTRLLSGDYKVAGIACSSHPEFGKMCALTLAGGFIDSAATKSNNKTNPNTRKNTASKATVSATTQTQTSGASNNNTGAAKTATKPRSF